MAKAVLVIGVEGSADVRRALGTVTDETRKSSSRVADLWKRTSDAVRRGFDLETRAALKAARDKAKAEEQLAKTKERLAKQASDTVTRQIELGVTKEESAAKEKERIYRQLANAFIREEKRKVAAAQETSRRIGGGSLGALGRSAFSAAGAYGSAIHGEIQGARARRAYAQRDLGMALVQGGYDRAGVTAAMSRLGSFAAQSGMDVGELAAAATSAQSEFTVFGTKELAGPQHADERRGRFERFLQLARRGRNMGVDPTQFVRLAGMLQTSNLDEGTIDDLLGYAGGAAQRGSVSLGAITQQGMKAMRSRISMAVAGSQNEAGFTALTPEQQRSRRNAAAQQAFVQTYAELQMEALAGFRPGTAGNNLTNVNRALEGSARQDKILTNIRNATGLTRQERNDLVGSLYERDPTRGGGAMRLKAGNTDALQFAATFASVVGNDPTKFANVFAGGGHGNPQALLQAWRSTLGALVSPDANGVPLFKQVQEMSANMGANTALTKADEARTADVFENDPLAKLLREQAEKDNALTDNTSALVNLSNQFAAFAAQNPFAAQAGGVLMGGLGGQLLTRGAGAGAGLLTSAAATAGGGLLGGLAVGGTILGGLAGGAVVGDLAARALGSGKGLKDADSVFNPDTWHMVGQWISDGFRANPPTVNLDPHTAAHAASTVASGANAPPPEARGP